MSSTERPVVVIGSGIAGLSAALGARRRNREVVVLSYGASGSAMMSGALDDTQEHNVAPSDCSDIGYFLEAFPLWSVTSSTSRVATQEGITRRSRGRDRSLLDLASLSNLKVALPRIARRGWDADLLAKSYNDDAWARSNGLSFHAVEILSLTDMRLLNYPDTDLAAQLDNDEFFASFSTHLSAISSEFGAVLLGPWLGLTRSRTAALSLALNRPVGECTSTIGGTAGLRFEQHASKALAAAGVTCRTFPVRDLTVTSSTVTIRGESRDDCITASSAIVASGGLVSGGLSYCPPEWELGSEIPQRVHPPFRLAFGCPGQLRFKGRCVEVAGSLYGLNLEEITWPNAYQSTWELDRLGLAHEQGKVLDANGNKLDRLLVCGQAAETSTHCTIDSIRSGWSAGTLAS